MKKQIILALALLAPSHAFADQASFEKISAARDACNKEASSQLGYAACEDTAFEALDAEMTAAVPAALANMDEPTAKLFMAAQAAWVAYSDAQVAYVSHTFEGGHGQALANISTQNDLTVARLKEIFTY